MSYEKAVNGRFDEKCLKKLKNVIFPPLNYTKYLFCIIAKMKLSVNT